MSQIEDRKKGKTYWRSLDDLADTPAFRAFVEKEFPSLASEVASPATRRQFLKLMGASAALAGFVGCRYPEEKILPHASRPESRTPGVAVRYATAMELSGVARGLLVTSVDGRPIKVEGNPLHSGSLGATDALAQASVLELYDPDRSKSLKRSDGGARPNSDWQTFDAFAADHFAALGAKRGSGFAVLSEASSSPTLATLRERFHRAYPAARWVEYEPISRDTERAGIATALDKPLRARLALDQARVIVCLDADILFSHPDAIRHARDFAAGRRAERGEMNRLYVAESAYSVTGGQADHRFPMRSSDVIAFARRLVLALADEGFRIPPEMQEAVGRSEGDAFPFARAIAKDVMHHQGRAVFVAGHRQPAAVHAICHFLNVALGNANHTVTYIADPDADRPEHTDAIRALRDEMVAGRIDTLLTLGGNPVYDAPTDLDFRAAFEAVETTIHLSLYDNETSRAATWHLPRAHMLESWGDARGYDGTIGIVQPLIAPFYDGRTVIEVLALAVGKPANGYDLVRATFAERHGGSGFESTWRKAIHDGVEDSSASRTVTPGLRVSAVLDAIRTTDAHDSGGLEIVFARDASLYDGRFANNGWLQELPDPISKVTWDNPLIVGSATADDLGIKTNDLVTVELGGRSLDAAVCVLPGQAAGSVTIGLGYGRGAAGRVGDGVGFDVYSIRTTGAMGFAGGLQLRPTGRKYELAATQDHFAIDTVGLRERQRRLSELYREADLNTFREHPDFARHIVEHPPLESLWKEHDYDGHRWGMAIDLNACIGCGACQLACQAENNIPIVGKEQVAFGREMHWIRVDRYFSGEPETPKMAHQPVACHHCENAPCEQVCPVAATVHDSEGLNVMVYNRCIGTRYCSNNCPYKVRRFNFFNYNGDYTPTEKMVFNPEVTVRARGVMEKCTFCLQRINSVKIEAKNEGRPIADGEITPACGQVCPTEAIVFGDLSDPESRVRRLHEANRGYAMLGELNIKPRTQYLAKLRNPSSELREDDGADDAHTGHGETHG